MTRVIIDTYNDAEWIASTIKSVYKYAESVERFDGWYPGHHSKRIRGNRSTDGTRQIIGRMLSNGYPRIRLHNPTNYYSKEDKMKRSIGRTPAGPIMALMGNEVLYYDNINNFHTVMNTVKTSGYGNILFPVIEPFGVMNVVKSKGELDLGFVNKEGNNEAVCLDVKKLRFTYVSSRKKIEQLSDNKMAKKVLIDGDYNFISKEELAKYDINYNLDRAWMYGVNRRIAHGKYMVDVNGHEIIALKKQNYSDIVPKIILDAIDTMTKSHRGRNAKKRNYDDFKYICDKFEIGFPKDGKNFNFTKLSIYKKMAETQNIVRFMILWLLNREPTKAENKKYIDFIERGIKLSEIERTIKRSEEYVLRDIGNTGQQDNNSNTRKQGS